MVEYVSFSLKLDLQWQLFLFLSLSYSVEEEMAAEMEVHGDNWQWGQHQIYKKQGLQLFLTQKSWAYRKGPFSWRKKGPKVKYVEKKILRDFEVEEKIFETLGNHNLW